MKCQGLSSRPPFLIPDGQIESVTLKWQAMQMRSNVVIQAVPTQLSTLSMGRFTSDKLSCSCQHSAFPTCSPGLCSCAPSLQLPSLPGQILPLPNAQLNSPLIHEISMPSFTKSNPFPLLVPREPLLLLCTALGMHFHKPTCRFDPFPSQKCPGVRNCLTHPL